MNYSCAIFTPLISGEVHPSCTRSLNRLFKDPELHIYKSSKDNRDEYRLELSDPTKGTKCEISKVFDKPDFTDTWVPVRAGGKDFGLHIFDIAKAFGGPDRGLAAEITTIDKDGDAPETPYIQAKTVLHF